MQLRVARHTNKIEEITAFYTQVLKLNVLGEFKDHDGYNGVFLGLENKDWHLEFTTTFEDVKHFPDEDDCLVLYPESRTAYSEIVQEISSKNIKLLEPKNPYWKENGILIKDPDGFYIIISDLRSN